jgi:hypothetical protein
MAVLLVWAQLWISTFQVYHAHRQPSHEKQSGIIEQQTSAWLSLIYFAIFFSLCAFVWEAYANFVLTLPYVPVPAIGLLATAISLTIIQIIETILSVLIKFLKNEPFSQPVKSFEISKKYRIILVLLGVLLTGCSIGGAYNHWWWMANIVFFIMAITIGLAVMLDISWSKTV